MRVRYLVTTAVAISLISAPAVAGAKITFSGYEGPPLIETGRGGTKIAKNGIDYWTSGSPPRRYQVIGIIEDKRDETWDGGHAIGSPTVAKKVKAAGGDAVIMTAQDEAGQGGGAGIAGTGFGFLGMGGSKTITKMTVIKYLLDAPSPEAE